MVAITPSGRALVDQITEIDSVLRAELRAGISRTERQQLAAVLVRLQRNLASAIAGGPIAAQPPRSDT